MENGTIIVVTGELSEEGIKKTVEQILEQIRTEKHPTVKMKEKIEAFGTSATVPIEDKILAYKLEQLKQENSKLKEELEKTKVAFYYQRDLINKLQSESSEQTESTVKSTNELIHKLQLEKNELLAKYNIEHNRRRETEAFITGNNLYHEMTNRELKIKLNGITEKNNKLQNEANTLTSAINDLYNLASGPKGL